MGAAIGLLALAGCGQGGLATEGERLGAALQELQPGTDFVVSAVSGPASAFPWSGFTASVTVCNQGMDPGYTDATVVLSTDATITDADLAVGGAWIGYLGSGECAQRDALASASVPDGVYYLGAIADSYQQTPESDESNNAGAGDRMGIGYRPDLIVSAVSGPPSVTPWGSYSTSVTVCNQGTDPSWGTSIQALLSEDSVLDASDAVVGMAPVNYLNPGECTDATVLGSASVPDGAYFVGAIVDQWDNVFELIEDNNAAVGNAVGVGVAPDLVVSAVSGPPSAVPGAGFSTEVTVCNQGTVTSPGADIQVLLSTDAAIDGSDAMVGNAWTNSLSPGQCTTVAIQGGAFVPPGAYFLGAIADPWDNVSELLEENNARAGALMGIGNGPDYIVSAVSGPSSALPGSSFSTSVTICNQGTATGFWTDVQVVLSTDSVISQSDQLIGMAPVNTLDPGDCSVLTVNGGAWVPDGTYYLGAIVDPWSNSFELIEGNNTRAGSAMGIGFAPDFIVSAVSGPPSAMPGGNVSTEVTVCNQGTTPSPSADVQVVLSPDSTITTADNFIGFGWVGNLNPGDCAAVTANGSVWAPDGAYTLGAIVDPWNNRLELLEGNNATVGNAIGVGNGPDLIVSAVSGPPSATPNSSLSADVTVCNQGTAPASWPNVQVMLSTDSVITATDFFVGYTLVDQIFPGDCVTETLSGSAWVPEGTYSLGAIVDPWNNTIELLEGNNTKVGGLVGIGFKPDYIVSAVNGPPSILPGGSFTTEVTVCNQGTTPGSWTDVQVVLSPDGVTLPPGQFVGMSPVNNLSPGGCATVIVNGSAWAPDGAYSLVAIVDRWDNAPELLEENNTRVGDAIGVGHGPDFIVSAVSGPPSIMPGSSFSTDITVCNQGTAPGFGTNVQVVLSTDTTMTMADLPVGNMPLNNLFPDECATVTVNGGAWVPDGTYYLGAIVDPWNMGFELLEGNNATAGDPVGIGFRPDFIVSAVSGPPSVLPWSSFSTDVTVCNQGTTPSPSVSVQVMLSTDSTITPDDQDIGVEWLYNLNPGQCASVAVPSGAWVPDGTYYLGAIVDPWSNTLELLEGNNATAGDGIGIGNGPDYIVSAVSGPPSAMSGSNFPVDVTVCNQGTAPGFWTDVQVVLSTDTTMTTADHFVGMLPVNDLNPGDCVTVTVNGGAWAPDGTYHLGAIVDPWGNSFELLESNNTASDGTITITF